MFVVFVDHDCLAYHDLHGHDVSMVVILNYFVIMLSLFFACYDVTAEKKMSHFVLKNDMFVSFEKCCLLFS